MLTPYAVHMTGQAPPKYRQIANDLRTRIEAGEYPADSRLPSKTELMDRYGVALATVNSAIAQLQRLGLAETIQGVGTFARKPPPEESPPDYRELAEQIRLLGERMDAAEVPLDRFEKRTKEQQQLLVGIKREVQDHARLLARMRRRLEEAGIALADADQRDEQAM